MNDVAVGLLAIAVGLLFCFAGGPALRVVISIWGAFVGFVLGAALVTRVFGDGFLSTFTGWLVGFVLAVLFAALAYLYYAVAVLLATISIGFTLGATLMGAIGVSWNWLIILVGVAVGVLLGIVALSANLPALLLVVVSAMAGASAMVTGLMLIVGVIDVEQLSDPDLTASISHDWWWYALYLALAIAGVVAQSQATRGHVTDESWHH